MTTTTTIGARWTTTGLPDRDLRQRRPAPAVQRVPKTLTVDPWLRMPIELGQTDDLPRPPRYFEFVDGAHVSGTWVQLSTDDFERLGCPLQVTITIESEDACLTTDRPVWDSGLGAARAAPEGSAR